MVVDRKDSRVSSKFIIFCFFKMKNRSQACFTVITGGGSWWLVVLDLEGGSCELVSQNEELGRCQLLKRSFHRVFKSELILGLEWCVSVTAKI